jgi:hypothetical protein
VRSDHKPIIVCRIILSNVLDAALWFGAQMVTIMRDTLGHRVCLGTGRDPGAVGFMPTVGDSFVLVWCRASCARFLGRRQLRRPCRGQWYYGSANRLFGADGDCTVVCVCTWFLFWLLLWWRVVVVVPGAKSAWSILGRSRTLPALRHVVRGRAAWLAMAVLVHWITAASMGEAIVAVLGELCLVGAALGLVVARSAVCWCWCWCWCCCWWCRHYAAPSGPLLERIGFHELTNGIGRGNSLSNVGHGLVSVDIFGLDGTLEQILIWLPSRIRRCGGR